MADSNITKHALANAMKALLEEQSFDKISVSDICERCGMNRKSFYYHFRDKHDLVNWIFDTEFIELNQSCSEVSLPMYDLFFNILNSGDSVVDKPQIPLYNT